MIVVNMNIKFLINLNSISCTCYTVICYIYIICLSQN